MVDQRVLAGTLRGPKVEHEGVVDAVVVVVLDVIAPSIGLDRFIEILPIFGLSPKPLMDGAPQSNRFRVARGLRSELAQNVPRFDQRSFLVWLFELVGFASASCWRM
jgi:hypothetical protein